MSIQAIEKPTDVTICDYCADEIDTDNNLTQWAHIVRGYISNPQSKATAFRFLWERKGKHYKELTTIYDFHAKCFDKLMREFLDRKHQKGQHE